MNLNLRQVMEDHLDLGAKVEVRRRFDARWARGFEIAEVTDNGYRLRRLSDKELLPVEFEPDDIRPERKRGTWWY